ncbi:MAG TPA: META domain-containing protein [Propionicimonas sp.]
MRRAIVMAVALAVSGVFLTGCAASNTDQLTATTWYLLSGAEKNPAWQWTVPAETQTRYTIRLEKEGTFSSQADCNRVGGAWQASGTDRIAITPGPMTMASCGERSFDILYAGLLGQARNWNVASTGMTLTLADGGRLDYTSVQPSGPSPSTDAATEATVAPTTTPAPTVTATVTATPTSSASTPRPSPPPTATVTATATATVTTKPTPTPPPAPGPGLTSRAWKLSAFALKLPAFEGTVPPDQQARYTIQFRADGTFRAQADCNTVNGTYSPADPSGSNGSLSLTPGGTTIVACSEGSYGDLYITGIANTASFAITGEDLVLTLVDTGMLTYR